MLFWHLWLSSRVRGAACRGHQHLLATSHQLRMRCIGEWRGCWHAKRERCGIRIGATVVFCHVNIYCVVVDSLHVQTQSVPLEHTQPSIMRPILRPMLQGGALGVCFNTPFDVVKSRMQDTTQKVPYTTIVSSLRYQTNFAKKFTMHK